MPQQKPRRATRILKRFLIIAGIIGAIILTLNIWFVQNAKSVLKNYIKDASNGKIKLELSHLSVDLWNNKLQIRDADLMTVDSTSEAITYHTTFNKLTLRVGSLWSLLVHKKLLLDSIKLHDPVVEVIQWRKDTSVSSAKNDLSIPQEAGKIYNSLLSALDEFGIRRIVVNNASISLINKFRPGAVPITVSRIFLDLSRPVIKSKRKATIFKDQQVVELTTTNQDISLPGGRHRIAFKSFRLQLFGQKVELDSCTISANPEGEIKSNYKIFFKKLYLSGVDFEALSSQNLIKADSVFCDEPFFDFNLYRSDAIKKKKSAEIPEADKIVRALAGNLNLGYVGVKNAGIHFDIYGKANRSFTNSNKDNFEMTGLRINPDSANPVSITRFDMMLRDYLLYTEDSSSVYSFDSLHFLDSRIALHNFNLMRRPGMSNSLANMDIQIPYFELAELNWNELIFDQYLSASSAILNNPVINYRKNGAAKKGKKLKIFETFRTLDGQVELDHISMNNGQVKLQLGSSTAIDFRNLNFDIQSNQLLQSVNKEGIRKAVERLSFSKAIIRIKDIVAIADNSRLSGENLLLADNLYVSSKGNRISANVSKVRIDNLQLDDRAETIELNGLRWHEGTVALNLEGPKNKKGQNNSNNILINNIEGGNTKLNLYNGSNALSTNISYLKLASLRKNENEPVFLTGLNLKGNRFDFHNKEMEMQAGDYSIRDDGPSFLNDFRLLKIRGSDSLDLKSSAINFTADINSFFRKDIHIFDLNPQNLQIHSRKWDSLTTPGTSVLAATDSLRNLVNLPRKTLTNPKPQTKITIDEFSAPGAELRVSRYRGDSISGINFPRREKNILQATGITLAGGSLEMERLKLITRSGQFTKPGGQIIGVKDGLINLDVSQIKLGKKDERLGWSGLINSLVIEKALGLSVGKSKSNLNFEDASLGNVLVSSETVSNFKEILGLNLNAWLHLPYGQFVDSNKIFKWHNARYENNRRNLSFDSLSLFPAQPLDSVLAHAPYQLDYITMKAGAVSINGLDVARYEKDSTLLADSVLINDGLLTVFRDKKPPRSPHKKDKPMPVEILKKIGMPLNIRDVVVSNSMITYSEKNATNRQQANIIISDVNASLSNIKSKDLKPGDSLRLVFNARFMDSANMRVEIRQAYLDSLSGFSLTAKIRSADLSIMNPVTLPLANIGIKRGVLDSLSYEVVAREDLALGKMDARYHDLRIKLVKNGDMNQSTFTQKILTFLANTFVIKKNNRDRTGTIFWDRTPEQSFVNYLVKITMSGLSTSMGVKKNRKMQKQYRKVLSQEGTPAIVL